MYFKATKYKLIKNHKSQFITEQFTCFSTRFFVVIELTSAVVIHLFIMQTARHVDFYPSLPLQTPSYIMPIFRVLFCGRYGHYWFAVSLVLVNLPAKNDKHVRLRLIQLYFLARLKWRTKEFSQTLYNNFYDIYSPAGLSVYFAFAHC